MEEQRELLINLIKKAMGYYSISRFADKAGISKGNLSRILRGKYDSKIRMETFLKIAEGSDLPTIELLEEYERITGYTPIKNPKAKIENEDDVKVSRFDGVIYVETKGTHNAILGALLKIVVESNGKLVLIKPVIYFPELEYLKQISNARVEIITE